MYKTKCGKKFDNQTSVKRHEARCLKCKSMGGGGDNKEQKSKVATREPVQAEEAIVVGKAKETGSISSWLKAKKKIAGDGKKDTVTVTEKTVTKTDKGRKERTVKGSKALSFTQVDMIAAGLKNLAAMENSLLDMAGKKLGIQQDEITHVMLSDDAAQTFAEGIYERYGDKIGEEFFWIGLIGTFGIPVLPVVWKYMEKKSDEKELKEAKPKSTGKAARSHHSKPKQTGE